MGSIFIGGYKIVSEEESLMLILDRQGRSTGQTSWMTHEERVRHIRTSSGDFLPARPAQTRDRVRRIPLYFEELDSADFPMDHWSQYRSTEAEPFGGFCTIDNLDGSETLLEVDALAKRLLDRISEANSFCYEDAFADLDF